MSENLDELAKEFSEMVGAPAEVTIRGEKSFTFSLAERNDEAADCISNFFDGVAKTSVEHDDECGSFVYIDA